jgi:hypothetical protein
MKKLHIAELANTIEFAGSNGNTALIGTAVLAIVVIGGYTYTHRAN